MTVDWKKVGIIVGVLGVLVLFGFLGILLLGMGYVAYRVWTRREKKKQEEALVLKVVER